MKTLLARVVRWAFPSRNFILEIAKGCDLRCSYCYRPSVLQGEEGWLDPGDLRTILGRLSSTFSRIRLSLSGGEPLLHPRLFDLLPCVLACDPEATILTNLSHLDRPMATRLTKAGVRNLQFTFFSTIPEEHDALRGPGDFRRALTALITAREAGLALVAILIVTPGNLSHLRETMTLLAGMGVGNFMINRYNAGFRNQVTEGLFLDKMQLESLLATSEEFGSRWKGTLSFGIPFPPCVLPGKPEKWPHLSFSGCPIGRGQGEYSTIDCEGNLRACNHFQGKLGNLLRESWDEILEGEAYRGLLAVLETPPDFCRGCREWETCRGGCRAASETWNGTAAGVDPWVRFAGGSPLR